MTGVCFRQRFYMSSAFGSVDPALTSVFRVGVANETFLESSFCFEPTYKLQGFVTTKSNREAFEGVRADSLVKNNCQKRTSLRFWEVNSTNGRLDCIHFSETS